MIGQTRRLCIFDFDGTLVNTIRDVAICLNMALALHGFPEHSVVEIEKLVGSKLEVIIEKLLPNGNRHASIIELIKNDYINLYFKSEKSNSKIYPGVVTLLVKLKEKGFYLAVHSNKKQVLLNDMVKKLFCTDIFDVVLGYTDFMPPKPDPSGVEYICNLLETKNAVYIGDTVQDIITASNACIPCIAVTWGSGHFNKDDQREGTIYVEDVTQLKREITRIFFTN